MLLAETEELSATSARSPFRDLFTVLERRTEDVPWAAPNASPLEVLAVDVCAAEDLEWGPSVKVMGRVIVEPTRVVQCEWPKVNLKFIWPVKE